MNLILLALVIGILVFFGVFLAALALVGKLGGIEERVRELRDEAELSGFSWRSYANRSLRLFRQLGGIIPRSPEEMSRQERRLVQAGIRRKDGPVLFLGVQAGLALALFAAFAVAGILQHNPILYALLCVFFGAVVPDLWLSQKVRRRKERIQLALPDCLDLQVVCVEAGLGLDQSLMRIGQELRRIHPDLSDELNLLSLEVNAGKSRAEALRNLAKRTQVDDLKALVAVLIQTDRFGTSIGDSLRVFSDSFRTKRRQRAEERAAKMGVKMIPPLFLFILPATFAVVVGPAIIGIAKGLIPFLRSPM